MNTPKSFFKKNWSNLLLAALILLLFIPQTAMPIKVFFSRLLSFSPSEIAAEKRKVLASYEWEMMDLAGQRTQFSNSEGKVTIINFWATWCPPCIAEMPSLQDLYDAYGDRVDFYFVTMEEAERVSAFLEKHGYSIPAYIPLDEVPTLLKNNSLPTTFVISKKGQIVMNKSGAANWNSSSTRVILDTLLSE